MAKGKGKRVASSGPKKLHGPKRHMFKEYKPLVKAMADLGLLTKYENFESWQQACQAKGKRNTTRSEFNQFLLLTRAEKEQYFKNLTNNK